MFFLGDRADEIALERGLQLVLKIGRGQPELGQPAIIRFDTYRRAGDDDAVQYVGRAFYARYQVGDLSGKFPELLLVVAEYLYLDGLY